MGPQEILTEEQVRSLIKNRMEELNQELLHKKMVRHELIRIKINCCRKLLENFSQDNTKNQLFEIVKLGILVKSDFELFKILLEYFQDDPELLEYYSPQVHFNTSLEKPFWKRLNWKDLLFLPFFNHRLFMYPNLV